ncbi:MAG: transglycosylase SLT domain-containing protein [Bdellovibrionota bacterium]
MAKEKEKNQIKQLLSSIFYKDDNISFFFLKKSKIKSEFAYQIPFKSKKKASVEKINSSQKQFQKETGVPWEFVQWSKFIGQIAPESKVYKTPFFDTQNIEIKNPWRICPIGEHWVRRHPKNLKTGKITDHDGHCRKNPSKKDLIKGDEMELISTSDLFLNPKVRVSKNNLKLPQVSLLKQNQYDDLISGWTAYWNDVFQLKNPLHPNYVKALMATESTFNPKAKAPNPKKIGLARGLLQLTEETTRLAKNHKLHEYRDHLIDLEYEDLWDPNKNIAFGVRHLFRKRETAKARLKREPTWFEVLMDYKGTLKSRTPKSEEVRQKLKAHLKLMGMDE